MSEIFAALIGAIASLVVSYFGIYGARKAGIGTTQEKLVTSLKDLVSTQTGQLALQAGKIKELEDLSLGNKEAIKLLQQNITELKELTVKQAARIADQDDEIAKLSRQRLPRGRGAV